MLVIKNAHDLIEYLKVRKQYAENQKTSINKSGLNRVNGMIYAFNEAIRAVEAMLVYDNDFHDSPTKELKPLEKSD